MKALLIEHDKTESVREIDPLAENKTRNLRLVQDCYKTVDGEHLPVYIRRIFDALDDYFSMVLKREYGSK